jgi:adenylate cyclase
VLWRRQGRERPAKRRVRGASLRQLLTVAAIGATVGLALWGSESLDGLELESVDARFGIRGEQSPPGEIVVLAIDDKSFARLDERWPFSRFRHARAVRRLTADGAAAIAYDIEFTEPSENFKADNALIRAVDDADGVVLATTTVGRRGDTRVFGGGRILEQIGARAGSALLPGDADAVVRTVPASDQGLDSFAVAAYETWRGEQVGDEGFEDGRAWVDFSGEPGSIETISFGDVAAQKARFRPGTFTEKLVVVGATAPSLQDLHATSVTRDELMSGPEIQAHAISTLDRGVPLREVPAGAEVALIILLALIPPLLSLRLESVPAFMLSIALGVAYVVAAQLAFNLDWIIPVVYPILAGAVSAIGTLALQYAVVSFERRRVREIFARFVPEQVVDTVLEQADDQLRLGGVEIQGTILFSDIRGFTGFSEAHSADRVLEILNRYLTEMTDAILDHGGTITTYIGDGIMALFGGPLHQPDHADRALATARSMLEEKLPRFNAWLRSEGYEDFKMGIGLNSGAVMAGNVGSDRRLEYTAIGDTVNTASRLESMTKELGVSLVVAEATRSALVEPAIELEFLGELEVRGKRDRVRVWTQPRDTGADRSGEPGTESAAAVT